VTDDGHTGETRPASGGWRVGPIQVAVVFAWCAAIAGFVVYLVKLDSFIDAYGGVGNGIVLLMWLTLLSLLYHATPRLRLRAVGSATPPPTAEAALRPPIAEQVDLAGQVDLVVAPSAALRNASAQGRMMSALGARAAELSDREIEMMDWGFAFGVAWAVARGQDPAAPEELVSIRALDVTQAVYGAYRGSFAPAQAVER
jgi:hypothetical protein